jgi:pimeloyl-ACP methyl ester carboxylesterase
MYFSGFGFANEQALFDAYLKEDRFSVSGFSYGAIDALEYALENLTIIRNIYLISPAFFQNKSETFKSQQLLFFKKNSVLYMKHFYKNIANNKDLTKYASPADPKELERLLYYTWQSDKLQQLYDAKVNIEIYLGMGDTIIDALECGEFFRPFAQVFMIKGVGHALI